MIGRRQVLLDQLLRLADAAERPNVTLQVIPFSAGEHGGMAGPFTMLTFAGSADRDEIYFEYSAGERMTSAPPVVRRHALLFAGLQRAALPPEESVALVRARAAQLGSS